MGTPPLLMPLADSTIYVKGATQDVADDDAKLAVGLGLKVIQAPNFGDFNTSKTLERIREQA